MTSQRQLKLSNFLQTTADTGFIFAVAVLIGITVGCTEKRPYQRLARDTSIENKLVPKNSIATADEFLFVQSDVNSTRTTGATFPMAMGEPKIVRFVFSSDSIRVVEVDPDLQFAGNPLNLKPVLTIPGTHKHFQCQTNADGKCSGKEEIKTDIPWNQQQYFEINAKALEEQEISRLPLAMDNLFRPCHSETGRVLSGLDITPDTINIRITRSYKTNLSGRCISSLNDLSDLTFSSETHYSFAKLKNVISADYRPLLYPKREENLFGFFDSKNSHLSVDNADEEANEKTFVKRWNPNRVVTYKLSPNFGKPEYKRVLEATEQAIHTINDGLKKAGAQLIVKYEIAGDDFQPGDLRNSSIVMVEDPINYGLLGYGPSVANPRTGEIVHARVAMYMGVIKQTVKNAYEDVLAEQTKPQINLTATEKESVEAEIAGSSQDLRNMAMEIDHETHSHSHAPHNQHSLRASENKLASPAVLAKVEQALRAKPTQKLSLKNLENIESNPRIKEELLSRHCYLTADAIGAHEAMEESLKEIVNKMGRRSWTLLSQAERAQVIDTLLPFVWTPTLIHEIGHTLGLRHNFEGSEDKENFYTRSELNQMGITRDFAYSSVMDYGATATNELQVLGKYDIAALRYGYAEQIEILKDSKTKESALIPIADFRNGKFTPKPYKFCTDEQVELTPNCNRFDEGTSLTEIAKFLAMNYEKMHKIRNFRNGRRDFSVMDDGTQIQKLDRTFGTYRAMFERYEFMVRSFDEYGYGEDKDIWTTNPELKDLRDSVLLAAQFALDVIKTPDTLCYGLEKASGNPVGLLPIRAVSGQAIDCFDKKNIWTDQIELIAKTGKSFQSRKSPDSTNSNFDQIDVRGIWLDKLIATKMLLDRRIGNDIFDTYPTNFLDFKVTSDLVKSEVIAVLKDEAKTTLAIELIDGSTQVVPNVRVRLSDEDSSQNTHRIPAPLHGGVAAFFELPDQGNSTFQIELAHILKRELPKTETPEPSLAMLKSIRVDAVYPIEFPAQAIVSVDHVAQLPKEAAVVAIEVGDRHIYVRRTSAVAFELATNLINVRFFDGLGREKLKQWVKFQETHVAIENEIETAIAEGDLKKAAELRSKLFEPVFTTDQLAKMTELGMPMIKLYLNDHFQAAAYYEDLLVAFAK